MPRKMACHEPGIPFSTLGRTIYANRKNTPAYSFFHGAHKQRLPDNPAIVDAKPGPGTYTVGHGALELTGPMGHPGFNSNARWTADTTIRTNLGLPVHTEILPPGPGLYLRSKSSTHLTGSLQQLTRWHNATRAGWQNYCARECVTPVVLSREHERERYGTHSPGPMTAAPVDSVGKQLMSNRKTQPRCAFGRSERFSNLGPRMTAAVPGPGAYNF